MDRLKIIILFLFILVSFHAASQNSEDSLALSPETREQYIQNALKLRKEANYIAAIQQLDTILLYIPEDAPALLLKGDLQLQGKVFKKAVATYKRLLPLNYELTITQINLSYALFMNHQPSKALHYAKTAWEQDKTNTTAIVNYINAMLWNVRTKEAHAFLKDQEPLLSQAQVLVLKARLYTVSGNFKKGFKNYEQLANRYPDKNYLLEYADVLLSKKEMKKASELMESNQSYFSEMEYNGFQQKLTAAQRQQVGTELVYFKDIAQNIRWENAIWWQEGEGNTLRFSVKAGITQLKTKSDENNPDLSNTMQIQFAEVSINERWNNSWSGKTELRLQRIIPKNDAAFMGFTGKQSLQFQPNDRRMFRLFYETFILNYTASLLQKKIRTNNVGYVTHLLLGRKFGLYSQGNLGMINDKNRQFQFFGSLYHLIRTEPTLKAGINFSSLKFKFSNPESYFSPARYLSTEVFADYSTALPQSSKFYLMIQAAAGMQKVEDQKWEPAFRFQSELGLRINQLETSLKYQTSNVALGNTSGYQFDWLTFKLAWNW